MERAFLPIARSVAIFVCLACQTVSAQLIKVADTDTAVPGSSGTFIEFEGLPAVDGDLVVFAARGSAGWGLYRFAANSLQQLMGPTTPIPEGTGSFTGMFEPSLDGEDVSFFGAGSDGQNGIYARVGATLFRVADENTSIRVLGDESHIRGGRVGFLGDLGVSVWEGGNAMVVADQSTPIPPFDIENFSSFGAPQLGDTSVVFDGYGSAGSGIYEQPDGATEQV